MAKVHPNRRRTTTVKVKVGGNGKGRRGPTKSAVATKAQAQGVGAITRRPFGTAMGRLRRASPKMLARWLDANNPCHLTLPRAIGPYTVVRTTQVINSSSHIDVFCPLKVNLQALGVTTDSQWAAACGFGGYTAVSGINTASNTIVHPMAGLDPLLSAAMITPAAITVQVMNAEALQTTQGIVFCGRSSSQYELGNSARTWQDLGNEFIQFQSPRLCSAGKLALRGVQMSGYPLDMSELANFRGIAPYSFLSSGTAGRFTWDNSTDMMPAGFSPIVVYRNSNVPALKFLVTIEWRVRFDPSNPAAGSHQRYGITSDSMWNSIIGASAAMGHGCEDIAEVVAEAGVAAYGARAAAEAAAPFFIAA